MSLDDRSAAELQALEKAIKKERRRKKKEEKGSGKLETVEEAAIEASQETITLLEARMKELETPKLTVVSDTTSMTRLRLAEVEKELARERAAKSASGTATLLEAKMRELDMLNSGETRSTSSETSGATSVTRMRLAEVEKELARERAAKSASGTATLLEAKMRELDMLNSGETRSTSSETSGATSVTRMRLAEVEKELARERASKSASGTATLLEAKMRELDMLKSGKTRSTSSETSGTTSVTRMRLAEVEKELARERAAKSASGTATLLEAKMRELDMLKSGKTRSTSSETSGTTSVTRMRLAEVEKELARERAAKTASGTATLLEAKKRELEALKASPGKMPGDGGTTTATRVMLAEVERKLQEEKADRMATTSRTRNLLEMKRKELEDLKASSRTTDKTREEIALVKREIEGEKAKLLSSKTKMEFEKHQEILRKLKEKQMDTDVAFVMDCTGSMWSQIDAAKNHITGIMDEIVSRDHSDGNNRITVKDFGDAESFKYFLESVEAMGGGDECEDVHGGLEAAIGLSWENRNRCLIHIADASAHGSRFHGGTAGDSYAEYNDADPRGVMIEDLIRDMKELGICYTFGKINDRTDMMIEEFKRVGGEAFVNCANLSDVKNFQFMSVTIISNTIETNWKAMTGAVRPNLTAISEVSIKTLKSYRIVEEEPNWKALPEKAVQIATCQVKDDSSSGKLQVKYRYKDAKIKMSLHPFAEGSQRISYFGDEVGRMTHFFKSFKDKKLSASVVFKTFKHVYEGGSGDGRNDFLNLIETQAISQYLATEFNRVRPREAKEVIFLDVKLVEGHESGERYYLTMEDIFPDYEEKFVKYNNNFGYVNKDDFTSTLNAFSHWTYDYTKHYMMVVDLQGIQRDENTYVLTDPAIHCKEPRFGSTNMGKIGMETFFEGHECSKVCTLMRLERNRFMKEGSVKPEMASVLTTGFSGRSSR